MIRALKILVLLGTATVAITEILSWPHLLDRTSIAIAWALVLSAALIRLWRTYRPRPAPQPAAFPAVHNFFLAPLAAIACVIAWIALLSPPNSADAMAYHLPRVVYWVQNRSVAFFPTPYLNQIMLQPIAEYFMLHTWLLSGGDRFVNLVQFIGFVGSGIGVAAIARELGLNRRAQITATLFCATLPNGILQASGAKNDYLLACWLVCMIVFAIRWARHGSDRDLIFLAMAAGLALGTKATAYLFAPPCLLAAYLASYPAPAGRRPVGKAAIALALGVFAINGPQYARNWRLSGSILGFDSAFGNGQFRWRNEPLGWRPAVSNLIRNTSEQLGARDARWNQLVYRAAIDLHRTLGIDPQDPAATWPGATYRSPRNANHEADANNRWHLLILLIAFGWAVYRFARRHDSRWLLYSLAPLAGFLAFCFYLKWQPFFARLELPIFVVASPLAAALIGSLRPRTLQTAVCLLLLINARLPLIQNWTRPLKGPNNLRVTSRDSNYFNDMVQWNNRSSYLAAVERTAASGCNLVGIDINRNQLEYPYQALLLERNPRIRFVHVGVENRSARYAPPVTAQPCVVFCPDCAGLAEKVAQYRDIGAPVAIDQFLLFLRK